MSRARILYVDDDPDICAIAGLSLELDPGFEVRLCGSGSEALATVETWRPDLVLLDAMMPQMDGPETLARLRQDEATATIPIVFVTARTQAQDVARFLALGARGLIGKPFDPMTFAAEVRVLMDEEPKQG